MTPRDPIVEEVPAARDAIARQFDYDVERLGRAMQERQAKSGRPPVRHPSRRLPVENKAG